MFCLCGQTPETQSDLFESQVRPLLVAKCYSCHGAQEQKGGIRLDSAAAFRQGGDFGPIVSADAPDRSRLVMAIRRTGDVKMPPEEPLSTSEVELLIRWVRAGAVWPNYDELPDKGTKQSRTQQTEVSLTASFSDKEKAFWSFQAVHSPAISMVAPVCRS